MCLKTLPVRIGLSLLIGGASSLAHAGAVYTATNDPNGNEVVVFMRGDNGLLQKREAVSTGGTGSGGQLDPLASQGSLKLSAHAKWLLAVNAGSDEVSVFRVRTNGLKLVDKVQSGGSKPVSIAIHDDLVYILNAGASPNIAGFRLDPKGFLTPLDGSVRNFDGVSDNAVAQVEFDNEGNTLVVTDRTDSAILTYSVSDCGLPSMSATTAGTSGSAPFGFVFDSQDHLLVVNAGSGTVSSYSITGKGELGTIANSAANGQKASCWIGRTEQGYVFTTNPGSSTLSSFYSDDSSGIVSLVESSAATGKTPLDFSIVGNRFLYAVDPTAGGIDIFKIDNNGNLLNLGVAPADLAIYAQGLAAD